MIRRRPASSSSIGSTQLLAYVITLFLLAGSGCSSPTEDATQLTAEEVLSGLEQHGAPIGGSVVYTAATDPNDLLGRPGGYAGKANFADTRLSPDYAGEYPIENGGSVEVFVTISAAEDRSAFIQDTLQNVRILGTEYHFVDSGVLVRVSGRLTPDQASVYGSSLQATLADLSSSSDCRS